jgi:D-Tyr-tRNAtyr deacylase
MKLLLFQAERFRFTTFHKTLETVADRHVDERVDESVVAFVHVEAKDEADEARVFRHTLKHLKWIANKRSLRRVVLHSFTHLGGENATPAFAERLLESLAERLRDSGYEVWVTPFGYFCSWELSVYGDSLAKVWKEI